MSDDVTCHVGTTSANMSADSIQHKEKKAKLRRNLHRNGVIRCKKVAKMVSYALTHVRTIVFLKNNHYIFRSNGCMSRGYGWAVMRRHVSQHMTQPLIQSRHWRHLTSADF